MRRYKRAENTKMGLRSIQGLFAVGAVLFSRIGNTLASVNNEGIYVGMGDLHNESEIARHLVNSLVELQKNKDTFEELSRQANIRAQKEADSARREEPHSKAYSSSNTPRKSSEEEDDEKVVSDSLVRLSVNKFKQVKVCGVCCACRNSLSFNVSGGDLNPTAGSPHCSRLILNELESILDKKFSNIPSTGTENGSEVLNSLFSGNGLANGFLSTDIVKRIVAIPNTHSILKTYLIVLLDSVLIDMCNTYNCDLCRALYAREGFIVYRVVRAANIFSRNRDMTRSFGIERIRNSLQSADEVRRLLVSLDTIFTLIKLNTGIQNMVSNTFNRTAIDPVQKNLKVEEVCNILLHMLGLTVVLNTHDYTYYFMQPSNQLGSSSNKLIPIPNAYNMSTVIYDILGETGINEKNIIDLISQYNIKQGSRAYIPQDTVLTALQMGGLPMHQQARINLNVGIPVQIPVQVPVQQVAPQMNQMNQMNRMTRIGFMPIEKQQTNPLVRSGYVNITENRQVDNAQYSHIPQGHITVPVAISCDQTPCSQKPCMQGIIMTDTQKIGKIQKLASQIEDNVSTNYPLKRSGQKTVKFMSSEVSGGCPMKAAQQDKQFQIIREIQNPSVRTIPVNGSSTLITSQPTIRHVPVQSGGPLQRSVQRSVPRGTPLTTESNTLTYGFH